MAPRYCKKRRRVGNSVPVWLPLPGPYLRRFNLPGPPCYMPISPDLYLPPWALPSSYYGKPMCHCVNNDFCTTSTCENSSKCLKMHPMFCPYSKQETPLDLQHDAENNADEEIFSCSDTHICSTCGALFSDNLGSSGTRSKLSKDDQNNSYPSPKIIQNGHFTESSNNLEQVEQHPVPNTQTEGENIPDAIRKLDPQEKKNMVIVDDCGQMLHVDNKPRMSSSRNYPNKYANSCCQTPFSNSVTQDHKKFANMSNSNLNTSENKRSSRSLNGYAEKCPFGRNVTSPLNTNKTLSNVNEHEFGCSSCTESNNGHDFFDEINLKTNGNHYVNENKSENLKTDKIHVDQLPEQLSEARNTKFSDSSGCCKSNSGSQKTCEMKITRNKDKIKRPIADTNSNNKFIKLTQCECHSSNSLDKASSKLRKLSDCVCRCASNKKHFKRTSKLSSCECTSVKKSYKETSTLNKKTDCECSTSKICHSTSKTDKNTSKSRTLPDKSYSSSDISQNPRAFKVSRSGCCSEASPDTTTLDKVTTERQSTCQCKFPPAYEHLRCSKSLNDDCSCSHNN